jgi:hypothetical protein
MKSGMEGAGRGMIGLTMMMMRQLGNEDDDEEESLYKKLGRGVVAARRSRFAFGEIV